MSLIAKTLERMGLEDTPEHRLSLKLAWAWLEATKLGDSDWMYANIEAMKRFRGLEHLERLEKLYQWVKVHPPGRTEK